MTPELYKSIVEILESPTNLLTQNSRAAQQGVINFNELSGEVEEVKRTFRLINLDAIKVLPDVRQQQLVRHTGNIVLQINRLLTLRKDSSLSDDQQKRDILTYFKTRSGQSNNSLFVQDIEGAWTPIVESIAVLDRLAPNDNALIEKATALKEKIIAAEAVKVKLDAVLATAQQDLSKKGVGIHSVSFSQQATDYSDEARSWKYWSIVLIGFNALAILAVIAAVLWFLEKKTDVQKVEVGIFGAGFISLVSFGVVLCVRNYFAAKHNEIINRHKANCLGTYDTFVDSADADRKAAVLIQATQTIFSHQRSGYLSKEAEVSSPNPVVEIVRHLPTGVGERSH